MPHTLGLYDMLHLIRLVDLIYSLMLPAHAHTSVSTQPNKAKLTGALEYGPNTPNRRYE